MDLIQIMESTRFVGEEFLTWLWFRAERQDGLFEVNDEQLELFFDDQMTLEAHLAESEQNRLSGGSPSDSPEAREALRRGKRVAKAKLKLVKDGREWVVTLTAATLGLSGIKIPAVLSREEDDRFYERMYLIEELEAILRSLYRGFLDIRLDREEWKAEAEALRAWAERPAPSVEHLGG